jgi:PAS domain-containing protein
VPVITMLLVWTHSSHTLMYQAIRLDTDGPVPMVDLTYGLFFWVNAAHSYIVLIVGSALLIRQGWRSRQVYRWQAIITGLAAVIPLVGNVIYLGRLLPFPLDLTPIGFVIAMLIFGWSIFRYKLFDLIPVAYQKIVEKMPDLVVVLDASNRIVELNPVAARLLNVQPQGVIGRDVKSVFANWQAFVDQCLSLGDGRAEIKLERPNRDPLWFDVQMACATLPNANRTSWRWRWRATKP